MGVAVSHERHSCKQDQRSIAAILAKKREKEGSRGDVKGSRGHWWNRGDGQDRVGLTSWDPRSLGFKFH